MRKTFLFLIASMLFMAGCIHNDLPYPVVVPNVTSMTVQDAVNVDIDYDAREVVVYVSETTDLRTVVVQSVEFDLDIIKSSVQLLGVHDLTTPLKFTLTTYQDYEWTLKAVRPVERYFTVAGQIGSTVIDEYNRRVIVQVSQGNALSNLTVTSFKLGPKEVSTYSKTPEQMKNFSQGLQVDVTAFGATETWTIYAEISTISVELSKINPWATSAYITAMAVAGRETIFKYRAKGASDWLEVDPSDITSDGGTFVADIKGLLPQTTYEVVVRNGEEETAVQEFTTTPAVKLPNASFEYASLVSGGSYYKFYDPACGVADGETMFWGSGNGEGSEGINGSASMGIVITTIDKQTKVDGKQSVCAMTSQMAGILAAGNIFTGQFAGLVGTEGGKVNFGRPWTTRPKALKLHCKYSTGKMDIIGGMPMGTTLTKDDYDRAQIKIAIGTWSHRQYGGTPDSPVLINTTDPKTFVDFHTDKSTVADGEVIIYHDGYSLNRSDKVSSQTGEWVEYTIPLEYHDLDTVPTHIIISCAAFQYGDYFSGCSKSKLWLDAFELIY